MTKFQILSTSIWIFGSMSLALIDVYSDLEDKYVKHFGNDPQNLKGLWPEAKMMAANETLAEFCSRIHFLNGRTSYELIDEAGVRDATLRFTRSNGTYEPMKITVVNFTSSREGLDYYFTKGMRDDCLLYLDPLNEQKSEYHLIQHICECVIF